MEATKILVLNAGSSSVKYAVFDTATDEQVFKGSFERVPDVGAAIATIPQILKEEGHNDLMAVAHRVAHGGTRFREPCLITSEVKDVIREYSKLAPQHNPPGLRGIEVAETTWPGLPEIAVFDTAFHQTIPAYAYTYPVPKEWRDTGLRRYGFHGTSHKYVSLRTAQELGIAPADFRMISCHLGNGASLCAIQNGVSVDTSMGMTPLEGIMMGSRSGDVDPGLFQYLHDNLNLSIDQIATTLHSSSGLKAISGVGNDMRDIEAKAAEGDTNCQLALQMFAYRVRKYIGAYASIMGGVDVITFTGGIGENAYSMRARICSKLEYMGVHFDEDKNKAVHLNEYEAPSIHAENSRVKLLVTQSREAWMIFQESKHLLKATQSATVGISPIGPSIPIAVSAHHVHLSKDAVDALFGSGYELRQMKNLKQPGNWAAEETVDLIGPKGSIDKVRILGPLRKETQIEVSRTEAMKLGVPNIPLRNSGDLDGTPSIYLRGPHGIISTTGLIIAARHIHTSPEDAKKMGVSDGEFVNIDVINNERGMVFHNVLVRATPGAVTEMHIDTDEANANGLEKGGTGIMLRNVGSLQNMLSSMAEIKVPTKDPADKMAKPLHGRRLNVPGKNKEEKPNQTIHRIPMVK